MKVKSTAFSAACAVILCASPALAGPGAKGGATGRVSGSVIFENIPPALNAAPVTKDPETCGASVPSEALVVGTGGALANAVVYLEGVGGGRPLAKKRVHLDQKACVFTPHVQAADLGSEIEVGNSDPVLHNARGQMDSGATAFNIAIPRANLKKTVLLRRPGLMTLYCDVGHSWMRAYIHVFDHPYYAVTGTDGKFSIAGVPPGTYQLVVWHERLGTRKQKVTVSADGAVTTSVVYQ